MMKVFKEILNKIITLLDEEIKNINKIREFQSLFNDIAGE